jgi:hypothetical protein
MPTDSAPMKVKSLQTVDLQESYANAPLVSLAENDNEVVLITCLQNRKLNAYAAIKNENANSIGKARTRRKRANAYTRRLETI